MPLYDYAPVSGQCDTCHGRFEVMQRIAAPMIGGMVSALVLTLLVLPAAYYLWRSRSLGKSANPQSE